MKISTTAQTERGRERDAYINRYRKAGKQEIGGLAVIMPYSDLPSLKDLKVTWPFASLETNLNKNKKANLRPRTRTFHAVATETKGLLHSTRFHVSQKSIYVLVYNF